MANIIPDGFKSELLKGSHNFKASGGNTFYIALYDTTLGPPYTTSSTVYSATNECSSGGGSGYPAGGQALGNAGVTVPSANTAVVDFDPEVLREYDIRGIVDKDLTVNTAYSIGRTFGHIVCSKFSEKKISHFWWDFHFL